jgi:lysophospholipase L1-like esterase
VPGRGKIAAALALVLLLAASLEAGIRARLFFHDPHVWREGLFRYRPDTQVGDDASLVTNNRGFFGPDLATPKPPDTWRVLLAGSSPLTNTSVPEAVAARLTREAPPGTEVEVVSTGLPRYTSWHVMRLIRNELLALEPDVLVLYLGLNDNVYNTNPGVHGEPPTGLWNWADRSRSLALSMLWYHGVHKRWHTRPAFDALPGTEVFQVHLERILDAAAEAGVRVVLAPVAVGWPTDDPALHARIEANEAPMAHFWGVTESAVRGLAANAAAMQRLTREYEAVYCELPAGRLAADGAVYEDLCHLTGEGRAALGRAFGDCIVRSGCLLPKHRGNVPGRER